MSYALLGGPRTDARVFSVPLQREAVTVPPEGGGDRSGGDKVEVWVRVRGHPEKPRMGPVVSWEGGWANLPGGI